MWDVLNGEINIFVVGVGIGGMFMGIVFYLKEKNIDIKIVIVELEGFILNGGKVGLYEIEGIGLEFIFLFLKIFYFDEIYMIFD